MVIPEGTAYILGIYRTGEVLNSVKYACRYGTDHSKRRRGDQKIEVSLGRKGGREEEGGRHMVLQNAHSTPTLTENLPRREQLSSSRGMYEWEDALVGVGGRRRAEGMQKYNKKAFDPHCMVTHLRSLRV